MVAASIDFCARQNSSIIGCMVQPFNTLGSKKGVKFTFMTQGWLPGKPNADYLCNGDSTADRPLSFRSKVYSFAK